MTAALGITVQPAARPRDALAEAVIICTATTSAAPVFDDRDLRPGVHINAVGSYQPRVQEIPTATVCRAKVVVDHRASALAETGDLLIPISAGCFHPDGIHAELGEMVAGQRPGRSDAQELTLFKSVGLAVQDVAAAARAVDNALAQGLGVAVPLG
jgi:ornithine cyclodeaminase/alanine dehydrogenase-like protein (mu-crystallin family)